MKNKLILYALHFFFLFNIYAYAQNITPGYYRVKNVGLWSYGGTAKGKTVKENCYAYVANGSYHMATGSGAKQNIESLQLWTGLDTAIVSPQTVIYIAKNGSNYNLEAQGTSVSQMTSYEIIVSQVSGTNDTYTLTTTVSGIAASLWVEKAKRGQYNKDGVKCFPTHYQSTTTSQGEDAYRQWQIVPISTSSDNYVAVNACLKVKDEEDETRFKYYAPYYASYPFKFVSPGMKAYYVSGITDKKYTLEEITSEVIPGATPVIIECPSDNPMDCKIEPLRGDYGSVSGNKLKGVYFCNLSMSPKEYSDCRTEFKAGSMRVWAVKEGKLVLTNNPDKTRAVPLALSGYSGIWLRANESYLPDVPSTADSVLYSAGKGTTISFDTDGGTEVKAIVGGEGEPVVAPANPTKKGYSFIGWDPALPDVFPPEDMTVKAQWKINQYTITFNTNGGTEVNPITQDYNTPITKPSDPTKEGYTFAGWDKAIPDLMPAENLTINAQWTTNPYAITFDTDGGTAIDPIRQDYGTTIVAPANPTKTGYTFTGWDKDIPKIMPAENVVIKALWQINKHTITFDTDGGSEVADITENYGTKIQVDAPTKEGYDFASWSPALPEIMPDEDLNLKAIWSPKKYTLSYYTYTDDVATLYKSEKVAFNSDIVAEPAPTKEGYTFSGWKETIPAVMPAKDVTITGTFTINQYTIHFDTDGGSEVADITENYGTAITKPSNPTKEGYNFAGWSPALPETMPAEDMTVKALWNKFCTITFNTDGGTEVAPITKVVGEAMTAPANPSKTGYTFASWDPEFPETMPENDLVLKAIWNKNQHKVTFISHDDIVFKEFMLYYEDEIVALTEIPEWEGHTFMGWDLPAGTKMPDEDVSYKAKWDNAEFTITFNTGEGGSYIPQITQEYGTSVTAPANPTRTGYTFTGWDKEIPKTMPAEDMTIKALWQINQYTITFDTDGGTEVTPKSITQDYGTAITGPSDPKKEGYTFVGWSPALPATIPAENMTIKAQWKVNEYTLSYYTYTDGVPTLYKSEKVAYNSEVAAEPPAKKVGYTFSGWKEEIPSVMPANDVTITGTFTINVHTITFDSNGGTEVAPITQNYGTKIQVNAPTKEGYDFAGWNPALPETMPDEDLNLEAIWSPKEYTLSYYTYIDDVATLYKSEKVAYNSEIVAEPAPTKEGYTFSGWKEDIPSVMPAKDVIINGTFTINQYTITFDSDGGSEINPKSITQDYGTAITKPTDPTKEGHTFVGWSPALPEKMPAENMNVKAQWKVNEYTLSYYTYTDDVPTLYKSEKIAYNSEITAEPPAKKVGYTFSGWKENIPSVMPANDVTITGTFTINKHSITYFVDGIEYKKIEGVKYGTPITPEKDPEKKGYDFAGWDPKLPETMPDEDLNLKAIWGPKTRKETYDFNEGWTWVSFAMFNDEMTDLGTVLSSLKWTSTDEIKGADVWGIYSVKKNKWVGYLAGFNDVTMYKIHSSVDQQLTLEGSYQNSKGNMSLYVDKGWNYLAYLSLKDLPVAEALQNYAASEGDILKSQTQSATYSNGKWIGDLQMEPRKGYMLYRAADNKVSFTYPIALEENVNSSRAMRFESKAQRFSSNMNVFAIVEGVMAVPGDSIVAYAVDGVRGGATIDDEGKASLTILGDNNADIYLTLMHNNTIVASAKAPINYASDNIVGSYANPTAIEFVEGSDVWGGDYNITAIFTMDGKKLPSTDIKTLTTGLYIIKYETLSDNNSNTGGCRVIRVVR